MLYTMLNPPRKRSKRICDLVCHHGRGRFPFRKLQKKYGCYHKSAKRKSLISGFFAMRGLASKKRKAPKRAKVTSLKSQITKLTRSAGKSVAIRAPAYPVIARSSRGGPASVLSMFRKMKKSSKGGVLSTPSGARIVGLNPGGALAAFNLGVIKSAVPVGAGMLGSSMLDGFVSGLSFTPSFLKSGIGSYALSLLDVGFMGVATKMVAPKYASAVVLGGMVNVIRKVLMSTVPAVKGYTLSGFGEDDDEGMSLYIPDMDDSSEGLSFYTPDMNHVVDHTVDSEIE